MTAGPRGSVGARVRRAGVRRRADAAGKSSTPSVTDPAASPVTDGGTAGFEGIVGQVGKLEQTLGIYDLAQFTARSAG